MKPKENNLIRAYKKYKSHLTHGRDYGHIKNVINLNSLKMQRATEPQRI